MLDLQHLKDLLEQAHNSGHYERFGEFMADNAEIIVNELEAGRELAEVVRGMECPDSNHLIEEDLKASNTIKEAIAEMTKNCNKALNDVWRFQRDAAITAYKSKMIC